MIGLSFAPTLLPEDVLAAGVGTKPAINYKETLLKKVRRIGNYDHRKN
jgi:hypothetical protein